MPGRRAQNSEIGPFPPAPRPLYIGSWTLKAQYPLCVFFTLFGCLDWGKGLGHNLLVQIFKTDFYDIPTFHNDSISDIKEVLAPAGVVSENFRTMQFGGSFFWLSTKINFSL